MGCRNERLYIRSQTQAFVRTRALLITIRVLESNSTLAEAPLCQIFPWKRFFCPVLATFPLSEKKHILVQTYRTPVPIQRSLQWMGTRSIYTMDG